MKFFTVLAPMALPWYRLAADGPAAREKSSVFSPCAAVEDGGDFGRGAGRRAAGGAERVVAARPVDLDTPRYRPAESAQSGVAAAARR